MTIEDELYRRALEAADPGIGKAELIREALRVFVRVRTAQRLAALGGTLPGMKAVPRRRPKHSNLR